MISQENHENQGYLYPEPEPEPGILFMTPDKDS